MIDFNGKPRIPVFPLQNARATAAGFRRRPGTAARAGNYRDEETGAATMNDNHRETGARKLEADHRPKETDQDAALTEKPQPYGLTEPSSDVHEKTRHSDGQNPPGTSPAGDSMKTAGAGPAIAEHSRDAATPHGARKADRDVK
jgi:hypothetical protein